MPQISKIRIVNFNYNDGNRFIPDELYDLASPDTGKALNTLFNLNNGGGKTVLVQLMMQPVHPKAMAGGRRIEDYFSHTGDHSYILLEWNLDGSKEKLLTGISIAASSSASTEEDKRGNSVKYYTFTTHYDTFSAYSISSLELSSNDNGNYVPAQFDYVREKAKSSRGLLTYYSSDDAVKWAEFLAEYGIFRTEWESVIEVLNKDEGGLNQYFDEAKTSDKLIAKFFIPAIEQKLMSVASQGTDCSLETMLINYAKKITDKESVIKQRDTNKKLLEDLEGVSEISDDLYNANDAFVANVSETRGFAAALGNRMNAVNEDTGRVAQEIEGQNTLITRIDHEKKSKNYYVASEKRDRVKADMEEALALLEQSKATLEAKRHEEDILQSAKLYRQIQKADGKITEIKGDRLFTISESITAMIESIRKINSKIETDLREITNDFNDLVEQCFLQGKRVYEDLRMIASSSKAHIYDGKPQIPMLKMDLPEEMELSEEASRMSIRNEIEKGANEIKEMLVNNFEEKQIQKRAKSIVGSERLLHKYIIRETVPVKVYKIDLNVANSSYKRWEDTLTQSSGAEKFVVFFSVVLTLMNYTRSTSGIVSKEAKSVLILDNPFGKITSAHLLKPMFDIAKHFNVQLICLSDINKSDVTSCFECVIKLVIKQQALSNFEIMTHEDNERIEHGYYKIMNGQMSLF